jgi:hypothetical protein
MKFKDEKATALWNEGLANNTDLYGRAVYDYALAWANLMETAIGNGQTVEMCAEVTSHMADTDGITGFMYGAAVSVLSWSWQHGEELRKWSNLKTQIGHEGEKANEEGGVLNPALLTIGKN